MDGQHHWMLPATLGGLLDVSGENVDVGDVLVR
jgi:hypothetical protein